MHQPTTLHRRNFMALSGGSAAAALVTAPEIARADTKEIEKANEKVVMDACKAIETVNADKVAPFLAEKFEFQLIDGQPIIKGKEAFLKFTKQFFSAFDRAEFTVHRSHALGNLVINERTDKFFAKEGGQDQTFHVTGFCVVKNGKIHEWKDYMVPK